MMTLRAPVLLVPFAVCLLACGPEPEPDPPPDPISFVALGDTGVGNPDQYRVAAAMVAVCATEPCDFAILLGDNFYQAGVTTVDDPQWKEKFEDPYADLDIPFYVVLGNHDLGGLGDSWERGPVQVEYGRTSDKWMLPAPYYEMQHSNVGFLMMETNSLFWDEIEFGDQAEWIPAALAGFNKADWIIGTGHHPYLSNGPHGNAGEYERIGFPLPPADGEYIKKFFDDHVCGEVDVYICGHDHSRQWIKETFCGAELIVSGAGAKTTDLVDPSERNETWFQAATEGFLHVTIDGDTFTGRFYDADGVMEYERTITKGGT